jgi:hypothetical protein
MDGFGLMVDVVGFQVNGMGCTVQGESLGCRVQGFGVRVQEGGGVGFRVWGWL